MTKKIDYTTRDPSAPGRRPPLLLATTEMGRWWRAHSTPAQQRLAELAGTSMSYLYRLMSGKVELTYEMAERIEKAAQKLSEESRGETHLLPRELIHEGWAAYARECRGESCDVD